MSRATIVGAPGSGRTVALSLLYAALVRYGGEREGHFRFHADPPALDTLGALYESFRAGEVPRWPENAGSGPTTISLSYDGGGPSGALSRAFHPLHHAPATPRSLQLSLDRFSDDQLRSFLQGGGGLTSGAGDLLDSSALVCILDASLLPILRAPDPAGTHPWDPTLGGLLRSLAAADRDHPRGSPRSMEPIFLLTKMDATPEPDRASFTPSRTSDPHATREARRRVAQTLLEAHLPSARSALAPVGAGQALFAPPMVFCSWVTLNGARLQGHATPTRGWEPDYPFLEFSDLIDELGVLASTVPPVPP